MRPKKNKINLKGMNNSIKEEDYNVVCKRNIIFL